MALEVTSRHNPTYKEVKSLINNSASSFMIIEGKKLLIEALQSPCEIQKIFIDKKNNDALCEIIKNEIKPEIIFMDNDLISSLYSTDSKPTTDFLVLALADKAVTPIDSVIKSGKHLCGLVNIQDPGNLGTIIRSALAFDFGGIFLIGNCVSHFNTKVIRASAGTVFQLPCIEIKSNDAFSVLTEEEYKIVATTKKSNRCINDLDMKQKSIFLFGNEGQGLPEEVMQRADITIKIPHNDKVESLNLSACASILFWEAYSKGL